MKFPVLKAMLAGTAALFAPMSCHAEEHYASAALQNDSVFGHDGGGYTSGIFLSALHAASSGDSGVAPLWLFRPADGWLGLPQPALTLVSLGQLIVTPADLTRAVPDPNDAPYIGVLRLRAAQVYVNDGVADMLALDTGMIGPASGAAQTQRFVHRLTGSERPQGWATQVPNRLLLSLEGYRGWRVPFATAGAGTPQADLVALAGGTVGTLQTAVGGSLMLRYGSGLERSFPTTLRLNGSTSDPVPIGRGWFVFGALSVDRLLHYAGVGSADAANTAQLQKAVSMGQAGVAYGTGRWSITFALKSANPLVESSTARQAFGSITYTLLLR